MKINYNYRLFGRSKGRSKNNIKISDLAKKSYVKRINLLNYNIIDVGSGYGESSLEIAKNNPNKFIVSCEKYIDGINKVAENSFKSNLSNISIFHGNVHQLIDEYCPIKSISEVWILFPDPWPKKRHFKRRLINDDFFYKINKYLKDKAIIHIASDSSSYISSILISIYSVRNDYKWVNQNKENWDYSNLNLPKTKYYKKALRKRKNPFYLKLIKL